MLFADDTSIIISTPKETEFESILSQVINDTVEWCKNNQLALNLEKTQFTQFQTKHKTITDIQVVVKDQIVLNTTNLKFLGLKLNNKFTWTPYGSELAIKLNKACYTIRAIKPFVSLKSLISVCSSYFHSLMMYGIIFWGNSPISREIFKIRKRAIRIITNKSRRDSCKHLFKQLQILTLPSQYIFSVLVFVTENGNLFVQNKDIHSLNTRNSLDLHLLSSNLSVVQRGMLYSGCNAFNNLPAHIKRNSENPGILKKYLRNT